jgi:hypothetical protein
MAIKLDRVIPWGRSRREYELMFKLSEADCRGGILGCGDGPASFNAEMTAAGHSVVSVDPIYEFNAAQIRERFETSAPEILSQVAKTPERWTWGFHKDIHHLERNRRHAMEMFAADLPSGMAAGRYRIGALPKLPFGDGEFKLALCSHFLFLYSENFDLDFHVASVRELCRVAAEVRIFPVITNAQILSPHLEPVRAAMREHGIESSVERVEYELQKDGNEMVRFRRSA